MKSRPTASLSLHLGFERVGSKWLAVRAVANLLALTIIHEFVGAKFGGLRQSICLAGMKMFNRRR